MELIEKFGINLQTLIAQIVNFLIVLFVLYKFAYKPVLKILHDRSEKIEKSLKDAEKIEKRLEQVQEEREHILQKSKKEAQVVLQEAQQKAEKQGELMMEQTRKEIKTMLEKTEKEIEASKDRLVEEAKADFANIVVASVEKIIHKKLSEKDDAVLIKQTVTDVATHQRKGEKI